MSPPDPRELLLELIATYSAQGSGSFQQSAVLGEARRRLRAARAGPDDEIAVLDAWQDLFRARVVGWGSDLQNPDAPFLHLTQHGARLLQHVSRDPTNPAGYLQRVDAILPVQCVARAYLEEALATFNIGCHKASAVMLGAASEAMILDLRDAMVDAANEAGSSVRQNLTGWKIKTVHEAIGQEVDARRARLELSLRERFDAYWLPLANQVRIARNDAGHPVSVEPVSRDAVHAGLLLFPELADVVHKLTGWVRGGGYP